MILLLLVVDVVLVAAALQSTAPRPQPQPQPTSATPSASATPSPLPGGTPTRDDSAPATNRTSDSDPVTAVAPTRILTALDAEVAWRATTGPCPDAVAAPELTVDGGASWKAADITGATGVRALQRMFVSSGDTASFIGAGGGACEPRSVRTFVAGDDFAENTDQLAGSWFLAPVGSDVLHSPGGDADAPCDAAVVVAPLDAERAALLCDDGSLHVTTDAGESWTRIEGTDGVIAVTEADDGFLVATAGLDECDGVQLSILRLEGSRSELDCVESPLPAVDLAGSTALDWTADAMWLWVDDRLLVSTDAGDSWI